MCNESAIALVDFLSGPTNTQLSCTRRAQPLVFCLRDVTTRLGTLGWVRRLARSGGARQIREAAGLSLPELAAELRVHPSTLWRWETGKTAPRASTALRWASVLSRLAAEAAAFPGCAPLANLRPGRPPRERV